MVCIFEINWEKEILNCCIAMCTLVGSCSNKTLTFWTYFLRNNTISNNFMKMVCNIKQQNIYLINRIHFLIDWVPPCTHNIINSRCYPRTHITEHFLASVSESATSKTAEWKFSSDFFNTTNFSQTHLKFSSREGPKS